MKRFLIVLTALIALSLAFAQQEGGSLTIAVVTEPTSMDPLTTNNIPSSIIHVQLFDGLVTYDEDLRIIPHLATSWEISEDGRNYTFNLREGVEFHDGEPFTAEDVKFAFDTARSEESRGQWIGIFADIESVEMLDPLTVAVTLAEPNAAFLDQIPYFGIPSSTAYEAQGAEDFAVNPVGTGPFRFVSWERDDRLVVERNEAYWLKRPNLDQVTFRAIPERSVAVVELEAGGVGVVQNAPAEDLIRLQDSANITVDVGPTLSYFYVAMNNAVGPTADVRVRRAIQLGVPMDQLVDNVFLGQGAVRAYTSFAPGNPAYDPELIAEFPQYDPEAAQQLLAEAGYENGFDTIIYTPTDTPRRQLGQLMQAALQAIGIRAEVRSVEFGTLLPLTYQGEAPIWILGWTFGTDPNNYSYDMFHSDPEAWAENGVTFNTSRYSNPEVDRLLEEARRLTDLEERLPLYHQVARQVFLEDVAHLAAYHQTANLAHRTNVHELRVDPNQRINLVTPDVNVWVE
jgi:peptide/nickel transport system substrate-binding protein